MTRFLFTLDDAVDTVLDSLYFAQGGEVFVPKINSFKMKTIIGKDIKIGVVSKDESRVEVKNLICFLVLI